MVQICFLVHNLEFWKHNTKSDVAGKGVLIWAWSLFVFHILRHETFGNVHGLCDSIGTGDVSACRVPQPPHEI